LRKAYSAPLVSNAPMMATTFFVIALFPALGLR
jgi:hypothetical protein